MSMLDKIISHIGTVNIIDKRENKKIVSLTEYEKNEIVVAIPAEFNAAILSLRNTFDFISQIVNNAVINQYFSEEECNFGKVADYIDKKGYILEMNKIACSKDYGYMSAYCNKIKHYNLIKTPFTTNFENLGEYPNGDTLFFINEVEYKNRKYQKKKIIDVLNLLEDLFNDEKVLVNNIHNFV